MKSDKPEPEEKIDPYLWDGSGQPDSEVERLEALLSPFRYDLSARAIPLVENPAARVRRRPVLSGIRVRGGRCRDRGDPGSDVCARPADCACRGSRLGSLGCARNATAWKDDGQCRQIVEPSGRRPGARDRRTVAGAAHRGTDGPDRRGSKHTSPIGCHGERHKAYCARSWRHSRFYLVAAGAVRRRYAFGDHASILDVLTHCRSTIRARAW